MFAVNGNQATAQQTAVSAAQKPDPIDQARRGSTTPLRSQKTAQTNVNEKQVHGSFASQSLSFPDPCRPRSYVLD